MTNNNENVTVYMTRMLNISFLLEKKQQETVFFCGKKTF